MRVVIFDLFGTLVKPGSNELAHQELAEYLSRKYGVNKEDFIKVYDKYEECGEIPRIALVKTLKELIEGLSDSDLEEILRKHAELHAAFTIPYEDTERAVQEAKEKVGHVAVVTDAEKVVAESVLASLGVIQFVDVIITSDDVKERKPSPKLYLTALKLLDTPSENAVTIGDSCKDVEGSGFAGIRAILLKRSDTLLGCEEKAHAVVSSLADAVDTAVNLLLGQ